MLCLCFMFMFRWNGAGSPEKKTHTYTYTDNLSLSLSIPFLSSSYLSPTHLALLPPVSLISIAIVLLVTSGEAMSGPVYNSGMVALTTVYSSQQRDYRNSGHLAAISKRFFRSHDASMVSECRHDRVKKIKITTTRNSISTEEKLGKYSRTTHHGFLRKKIVSL